jgi:hypothetical protein
MTTSKLAAIERDTISILEQQRDDALDRLERLRDGLKKLGQYKWGPEHGGEMGQDDDQHTHTGEFVHWSDIRALLDGEG